MTFELITRALPTGALYALCYIFEKGALLRRG